MARLPANLTPTRLHQTLLYHLILMTYSQTQACSGSAKGFTNLNRHEALILRAADCGPFLYRPIRYHMFLTVSSLQFALIPYREPLSPRGSLLAFLS
jgi:hypothetical protein